MAAKTAKLGLPETGPAPADRPRVRRQSIAKHKDVIDVQAECIGLRKYGASLSLLEGKRCAYCGNELDLEQYDWVIREYRNS